MNEQMNKWMNERMNEWIKTPKNKQTTTNKHREVHLTFYCDNGAGGEDRPVSHDDDTRVFAAVSLTDLHEFQRLVALRILGNLQPLTLWQL